MQPIEVFTSEDLSKAENRVNVALFGIMTQDWFREWFLAKLDLPQDSTLYPPANTLGFRPDLVARTPDDTKTRAWIEVELSTNPAQIEEYQKAYEEPIKAVWGRRDDGGHLSLEEIAEYLEQHIESLAHQTQVNAEHLIKLIRRGIDGHRRSTIRREVSREMRSHKLVARLSERLEERLRFTSGSIKRGELKADAIGEAGFSLRAYSPVPRVNTVFLLSIRGGSQEVRFPTKGWLEKYLPQHSAAIEEYTSLLSRKGLNIDNGKVHWSAGTLHLDAVLAELDELAECILALANS